MMNNIAGLAGGALIHISKKVFVTVVVLWLAGGHACAQINAYAKVTSITGGNVLNLSNINETFHTFTVGQEVVIMQMQGNVIGANTANNTNFGNLSAIGSTGLYEIRRITARTATSITVAGPLTNTYSTAANASLQVISNRVLGNPDFVTTADLTALDWDGNIGGVIALKVLGTLTLAHSITANGNGFRGGATEAGTYDLCSPAVWITNDNTLGGRKGEGIFKRTAAGQEFGRAKILNGGGGGNRNNAGGGGGGNFSQGGTGGPGYDCAGANASGGIGGISLSAQISVNRIFMGGGGGAGQQDQGQATGGGDGGGIILMAAARVITTGNCTDHKISADGLNSITAGIDGAGGAGAGGTIVMEVGSYSVGASCPLIISANGGDGGNSTYFESHGGGGGGGQGRIIFSGPAPANTTVSTNNGAPGCNNDSSPCNSLAGAPGNVNNAGISNNTGNTPLPVTLLYFNGLFDKSAGNIQLQWTTVTERNNSHFTLERSPDGIQFSPVATVTGQGDSKKSHTYHWNDEDVHAQRYYYRLQQTDLDGKQEYVGVIVVYADRDMKPEVYIYPNPATAGETVQVDFIAVPAGQYILQVVSMEGREIMRKGQTIVSPFESIALDMPGAGKGIYSLIISSEKYSLSKKILVR